MRHSTIHKVRIYDMDGTIVDSSHRYRTVLDPITNRVRIDLDYWRANEYRAMDDGLLPLASQYMRDLRDPNVFVVIATARVMNGPDWQFVHEVIGNPDCFICRTAGENISGADLKIRGIEELKNAYGEAFFQYAEWEFYEDNTEYLKKVCDHFNIRGIYVPSVQGH